MSPVGASQDGAAAPGGARAAGAFHRRRLAEESPAGDRGAAAASVGLHLLVLLLAALPCQPSRTVSPASPPVRDAPRALQIVHLATDPAAATPAADAEAPSVDADAPDAASTATTAASALPSDPSAATGPGLDAEGRMPVADPVPTDEATPTVGPDHVLATDATAVASAEPTPADPKARAAHRTGPTATAPSARALPHGANAEASPLEEGAHAVTPSPAPQDGRSPLADRADPPPSTEAATADATPPDASQADDTEVADAWRDDLDRMLDALWSGELSWSAPAESPSTARSALPEAEVPATPRRRERTVADLLVDAEKVAAPRTPAPPRQTWVHVPRDAAPLGEIPPEAPIGARDAAAPSPSATAVVSPVEGRRAVTPETAPSRSWSPGLPEDQPTPRDSRGESEPVPTASPRQPPPEPTERPTAPATSGAPPDTAPDPVRTSSPGAPGAPAVAAWAGAPGSAASAASPSTPSGDGALGSVGAQAGGTWVPATDPRTAWSPTLGRVLVATPAAASAASPPPQPAPTDGAAGQIARAPRRGRPAVPALAPVEATAPPAEVLEVVSEPVAVAPRAPVEDPVAWLQDLFGWGAKDDPDPTPRAADEGVRGADAAPDASSRLVLMEDRPADEARTAARATPLGRYLAEVEERILARWSQAPVDPHRLAVLGRAEVILEIVIDARGRVSDPHVVRGTGDAWLDHLALDAVPARFPRMPPDIGIDRLHHRILLRYRSTP